MIIWYPANFMPVVKKQSHLCVTSIIITSGLFITMNNEHSLCLWQCSLHNLTNGFSLSSGRLSYEVHEFDCGQAMLSCEQITDQTRAPGASIKTISIPWSDEARCQSSLCSRHHDAGRVTCHVSRVRHVSGRTSQHWPSPPATFLPPGAAQVSGVAGAYQHQLALHPLSTHI